MSKQKSIFTFLGLGSMQAWLWSLYLNGPIMYRLFEGKVKGMETAFSLFLVFHSLSFLMAGVFSQKLGWIKSRTVLISSSSILLSLNVPIMYQVLAIGETSYRNAAMIFFLAVSGISGSIMILSFGEAFSEMHIKTAGISYSMAVTFGTVLFYIIMYLPPDLQSVLVSLLPLSALAFLLPLKNNAIIRADFQKIDKYLRYPFSAKFTLLVLFFYLVGGLMQKIVTFNVTIPNNQIYWLTNVVYCLVALFAGISIYKNPDMDLKNIYQPVLPILGVGFILLPILSGNFITVPFLLYQAGFALFDLYTWLLFAYLTYKTEYPAKVFGYGMFLITISILLGNVIFDNLIDPASPDEVQTRIISVVAAAIMFLCTQIFKGNRETFSGWEKPLEISVVPEVVLIPSLTKAINTFRSKSPLTPREEQILSLLLEGRNNPYIRENLNISVNTLKTHLKNIYQKFNVENRQDLIDSYRKQ